MRVSKVGLVLEGGGMRGLYTAGVLDYFLDEEIYFHNVIGVSAGACNAVSYIAKQRGRNLKVNTEYIGDKRYLSMQNLIKQGSLFGMDFIFKMIPDELVPFDYDAYFNSPMHLTIVATNCETGEPEYLDGRNTQLVNEYLRASSSIPMFAPIVELEGKKLLDGGTADSIPIQYSIKQGHDKNIVVVTRNADYIKKPEPFKHIYTHKYKQYPKLIHTIGNRHENYNNTLKSLQELEAEGKIIVIKPTKLIKIDRFEKDKNKLEELYYEGYEDAKTLGNKIKLYCSNCDNVDMR